MNKNIVNFPEYSAPVEQQNTVLIETGREPGGGIFGDGERIPIGGRRPV